MSPTTLDVLVVDDIKRTARRYIDVFRQDGKIDVCFASSVGSALTTLQTRTFNFAVIDLHMPLPEPFPPELRPYASHFLVSGQRTDKWSTNIGQLVGMYINDQMGGQPPFAYLSAVAGDYRALPNGKPLLGVYDKAKVGAREFMADVLPKISPMPPGP